MCVSGVALLPMLAGPLATETIHSFCGNTLPRRHNPNFPRQPANQRLECIRKTPFVLFRGVAAGPGNFGWPLSLASAPTYTHRQYTMIRCRSSGITCIHFGCTTTKVTAASADAESGVTRRTALFVLL